MKTKMQTSVIKKAVLLALMLVTGSAWAEWVNVGGSNMFNSYIDPATIRKDGNLRKVWSIQDLKQRYKNGEMSRRAKEEYDCQGERSRLLSLSFHSEPMAGGTTLSSNNFENPDHWTQIPPDSAGEIILKIVCAK